MCVCASRALPFSLHEAPRRKAGDLPATRWTLFHGKSLEKIVMSKSQAHPFLRYLLLVSV